jgi:acyl-CoA synthetase (NDP forming)
MSSLAADVGTPVVEAAQAERRNVLLEHEVYALLEPAGIGAPRHRLVAGPDEVDDALCDSLRADEAVVKVVSAELLHKSDVGGVVTCLNDAANVRAAVAQVLAVASAAAPPAPRALVCERVRHRPGLGRELLAGFRHDPAFGAIVVLGVGGLDTEYLIDALRPERARVVLAAEGLTEPAARAALRGTLVGDAFAGRLRSTRGAPDREAELVRLLMNLARLAATWSGFEPPLSFGLAELELNPVVEAAGGGFVALDGSARLHRQSPLGPPRPVASLRHLLTPTSAVVAGASARDVNVGRVILANLLESGGIPRKRIWALHPEAGEIAGCRAWASPADLPEAADLAVVALPAERGGERTVIDLVEGRHAKSVILVSGGFGETGTGRRAEERMRAAIEASHRAPDGGVLVNGGNCLGIVSRPGGYNTFFLPAHKLPFREGPGGGVASISQSGAYLVTQISNLDGAVSPRYAISFGNQIDVTVSDYLEYLKGDDEVKVFAVYLEGFRRGDGARFLEVARELTASGRAVLLYKAGRSPEGRAAVASHTAAAVGDHDVCRELVRAAGVVDCRTLNTFEDALLTFSFLAERRSRVRRIAVLSNAGFECAAAADRLYGLELADLQPATRARLRELLPAVVDVHNPVDATPMARTEVYAGCVDALIADPKVDAVVVAGVPATPYLEDLARGEGHSEDVASATSLPSRLIQSFRATHKPMVFSLDAGPLYSECVRMMTAAGLPCFPKVDRATRALALFAGVFS